MELQKIGQVIKEHRIEKGLSQTQFAEALHVTRQAVSGHGDSQQTYSMKGINLYVMWPDEESVSSVSEKMKEYLAE